VLSAFCTKPGFYVNIVAADASPLILFAKEVRADSRRQLRRNWFMVRIRASASQESTIEECCRVNLVAAVLVSGRIVCFILRQQFVWDPH